MSASYELKEANSPDLVLTNPTPAERVRIWTQTHGMWGTAISVEDYIKREEYLTTVPLARNGGMTHWLLTDSKLPPNKRPLLSSCESIRKPAVSAVKNTKGNISVKDGFVHGIASVFSDPIYRGRGYASRMMAELGPRLKTWGSNPAEAGNGLDESRGSRADHDSHKESLCSVLYSDIGKSFYAKNGWLPFPSTHLALEPDAEAKENSTHRMQELLKKGGGRTNKLLIETIATFQLADLTAIDEKLMRQRVIQAAKNGPTGGPPAVAILPSLDAMLWHTMREDFMSMAATKGMPEVRGAIVNGIKSSGQKASESSRMWVYWTRSYHGKDSDKRNTLYVLRVVLEDRDDQDDDKERLTEEYVTAFRTVLELCKAEAAQWNCADVQMWNPSPAVRALAKRSGVAYKMVDRQKDSIPSLMWYGEGKTEDVNWVANEKYGWC